METLVKQDTFIQNRIKQTEIAIHSEFRKLRCTSKVILYQTALS